MLISKSLLVLIIPLLLVALILSEKQGAQISSAPVSALQQSTFNFPKDSVLEQIRYYWRSNIDSVACYASALKQYAVDKKDLHAEAEALDALGYAYEQQAKYDTALTIRQTALQIWQALGDLSKVAWCYHSLGNIYDYLGVPDAALSFHYKALQIRDSLGNEQDISWSHNRIGEIYSNQMKYDRALYHQQRALEICEKLSYKLGLASIHNGLAMTMLKQYQLDKAMRYAWAALALADSIGDAFYKATALNTLGDVNLKRRSARQALTHYAKALSLYEKLGQARYIAATHIRLGEAYLALGEYEQALKNTSFAIDAALRIKAKKEESEAYRVLTDIALAKGDFKQAVAFQEQYLLLRDSILSEERERNIAYLEEEFESKRKDEALKVLAEEKEREVQLRFAISLLAGFSVVVSAIAAALFFVLMRRRKAEAENEKKRAEVYERMARVQAELRTEAELVQADLYIERKELEKANRALEQALQKLAEKRDEAEREHERAMEANRKLSEALAIMERQRDELAEQRKIAEEASAFKTELLAIAAHDLKNPLQVIIGFAQLMKEKEGVGKFAMQIEDAARKMLALIQELLESSAAQAGKLELQLAPTNIGTLAALVVEFNRVNAEKKGQTIYCDAQPECYAMVDSKRFMEVLENLISNAIKYSLPNKRIFVTVQKIPVEQSHRRRRTDWPKQPDLAEIIEIAVRDEGPGIAADEIPKLFTKFQKLSARPTAGESSTGLGLSIVKQLVELHDGKVWAESEGEGKGCTFFIALPACRAEGTKTPNSSEQTYHDFNATGASCN